MTEHEHSTSGEPRAAIWRRLIDGWRERLDQYEAGSNKLSSDEAGQLSQCVEEADAALRACADALDAPRTDTVLAEIVGDLHALPLPWEDTDVDDRNTLTAKWRALLRAAALDAAPKEQP